LSIGLLYDRLTSNALEQLLGEKISTHLTATTNRLNSYLEARRCQLETLANYPGVAEYATAKQKWDVDSEVVAVLQKYF